MKRLTGGHGTCLLPRLFAPHLEMAGPAFPAGVASDDTAMSAVRRIVEVKRIVGISIENVMSSRSDVRQLNECDERM